MKKIFFYLFLAFILFIPSFSQAQNNHWTIEKLHSNIILNQDNSATITEDIMANCKNCQDQHGIFRILPTQTKVGRYLTLPTPVKLKSITNFNNQPIPYTQQIDYFNHTVTWKIGDPNITVTGLNNYKIIYTVNNVNRLGNKDYDEFYWNLVGNYWQMPIKSFTGNITFPNGITEQNTNISYYTGKTGSKNNNLADYNWIDTHTLQFKSTKQLDSGNGITVSVTFPKNIIHKSPASFLQLYGQYLWLVIPLLAFIICLYIWHRFGRDPKLHRTVVPEFEIPEKLTPIEMSVLQNNGYLSQKAITADIINLAVNGYLTIKEIPKVGLFEKKDFQLKLIKEPTTLIEKRLVKKIFGTKKEILISKLKDDFSEAIGDLQKIAQKNLIKNKLMVKLGFILLILFMIVSLVLVIASVVPIGLYYNQFNPFWATGSIFAAAAIFFLFAPLMKQRTVKGTMLLERIRGFELYIKTAEKYRQQFNEKENIFEKYLPYAILFGLTEIWIKNMQEIYGEKYFYNHIPAWYILSSNSKFNIDNFNNEINNLSASINSNAGNSSGFNGGGFSGGGSGGGGGGGW